MAMAMIHMLTFVATIAIACEVGGIRIRHRFQSRERPRLVGAVQAAPIRVENHKNAPMIRERESADDRWRHWFATATSIDDQSTAMKQPNSHTRSRAAS